MACCVRKLKKNLPFYLVHLIMSIEKTYRKQLICICNKLIKNKYLCMLNRIYHSSNNIMLLISTEFTFTWSRKALVLFCLTFK